MWEQQPARTGNQTKNAGRINNRNCALRQALAKATGRQVRVLRVVVNALRARCKNRKYTVVQQPNRHGSPVQNWCAKANQALRQVRRA